ncbi:peptidase S58 family protein [Nakamurella silvestris]|nr:peptidase S58 family protein [Nakamurella silvestris]
MPAEPTPGPYNALIDVPGIRVGHYGRSSDGYLGGTSVVLAPAGGMTGGVDVRGGGPGTRETDLLDPIAAVESVNAFVLTGGSAYGLASAGGVADTLGRDGIGFRVGPAAHEVVPIVPAAVIFDLGRGGDFHARPDAEFGSRALAHARSEDPEAMAANGNVGVGVGALTARMRGGVGNASLVLADGTTVAALVVANATGSPFDPATGTLWGAGYLRQEDGPVPVPPSASELAALLAVTARPNPALASVSGRVDPVSPAEPAESADPPPGLVSHTTLAVIATDATLTKAQCKKLAGIVHDGMARALNPVHTMFDGDVAFAAATGARPAPDVTAFFEILTAAADVVTRAIVRAVLSAESVTTPAGTFRSYSDLAPSTRPPR